MDILKELLKIFLQWYLFCIVFAVVVGALILLYSSIFENSNPDEERFERERNEKERKKKEKELYAIKREKSAVLYLKPRIEEEEKKLIKLNRERKEKEQLGMNIDIKDEKEQIRKIRNEKIKRELKTTKEVYKEIQKLKFEQDYERTIINKINLLVNHIQGEKKIGDDFDNYFKS